MRICKAGWAAVRELGIPAVVGCGDAMMRLATGDRVHVDGERGTVELLQCGAA